jgi:dihydrofolate reductase
MRKVHVYDTISLDGYFTDAANDMSWAHRLDPEWQQYVAGNAGGNGALLFGRVTYQQMAAFWPTPQAAQMMPEVAAGMNRMPKYVVSRRLATADWENTTLLTGDLATEIRALKAQDGPDVVILGSGNLVSQLTELRLIDGYQLVLSPTILGKGRTLFETVGDRRTLTLTKSKAFGNGNVVLWYEPA